jgi:hypothetical protein
VTIKEALLSAARLPVLGLLFLLISGQMAAVVAAFKDGRSRRSKCTFLSFLLVSAAVLWLCLSVIAWEINFPNGTRNPPAGLAAFCTCPIGVLWTFEAVIAALLAFTVWDIFRYRKNHVTQDSVKQAMDLLPVGIGFGEPDGAVCFRNLVMDHLSVALLGKLFTDWNVFQAAADGDQVSAEGRVWQLRSQGTLGTALTQFTATDITEQAGILAALQEKNRKLKDIQMRLKIYSRQAERIIIAQELLTARMTVHDALGNVLLESRHAMSDPGAIDEELLVQALKNANTYLLREYEGDDTAVDPLTEAIGIARSIGVKVELTGLPPMEEEPRKVFSAAIRECAANAVKHAEGDHLTADSQRLETGYAFTLCSNGHLPSAPIHEAGGLLSLRVLVENHRGDMHIDIFPEFRLTIRLPL